MRPLSVFMFIKGSVKKILPVVITVCLAVSILYFLSMFTRQLDEQVNEVSLYPVKNMSMITGDRSGISASDIENIKKNIGDENVYFCDSWNADYYSIVGKTGTQLLMFSLEDIPVIMDIQNLKLTQGHLPQNKNEIVLHKKLAANRGIKLGAVISKKDKGWYINDDMKVVGLFEGESVIGIGYEGPLEPGMPWGSVIIDGDKASLVAANKYIEANLAGKYSVNTVNTVRKMLENFNAPMNTMKLFIGFVLVLVVGIFLSNIITIQYTLRKKELELLHAIGYTKKYIILKGFKEIGIASIIGYLAGITLAVLIGWGINIYFLDAKGLSMTLLSGRSILTMFIVPIAITTLSMTAPVKLTKFRDIS